MDLNKKTIRYIFVFVAASIFLYWLLNATEQVNAVAAVISGITSPLILGAVIAFILNVPMRAIEKYLTKIANVKLRRTVAILLTLLVVLLVLALVFWLLIPQLTATIESLIPKLTVFFLGVGDRVNEFLQDNPELLEWLNKNTDLEHMDWAGLVQKALSMVGNSVSTIMTRAFSAIGSVANAVMDLVIGLVFAIYCLGQKETLARQARKLSYAFLSEKVADGLVRVLRLSNSTFSNFLSGQCVEVCILGSLFAVTMAIFQMPYIPLVSVLVAVTAFIPIVGAWVGCILGAFLIFVANPLQAVWFVIMFLVLQQIENNVIYPRVVGTSIGLSGMWVLVAVAVGGELMGVAGMFLMIPVASVLYTLLQEYTGIRLNRRNVNADKLEAQPPEIRSKFSSEWKENLKNKSNTKKRSKK